MIVPATAGSRPTSGRPSQKSAAAELFVAGRIARARALGHGLADHLQDPGAVAFALNRGLTTLADPAYVIGQQSVAPGIGPTHGVRSPLHRAVIRAFAAATQDDSPASLLLIADRLLVDPALEARWFAFAILERTLDSDPERSWQLIRRAV